MVRSNRASRRGLSGVAVFAVVAALYGCESTLDGAGQDGQGGASTDACSFYGPVNEKACTNDGAQCSYADTSCGSTWTCKSGKWHYQEGCMSWSDPCGPNGPVHPDACTTFDAECRYDDGGCYHSWICHDGKWVEMSKCDGG